MKRYTESGIEILSLKQFREEMQRSRQNVKEFTPPLYEWGSPREHLKRAKQHPPLLDRIVEAIAPEKPKPAPRPRGAPKTTRPVRRGGIMGLVDKILPRSKRQ